MRLHARQGRACLEGHDHSRGRPEVARRRTRRAAARQRTRVFSFFVEERSRSPRSTRSTQSIARWKTAARTRVASRSRDARRHVVGWDEAKATASMSRNEARPSAPSKDRHGRRIIAYDAALANLYVPAAIARREIMAPAKEAAKSLRYRLGRRGDRLAHV